MSRLATEDGEYSNGFTVLGKNLCSSKESDVWLIYNQRIFRKSPVLNSQSRHELLGKLKYLCGVEDYEDFGGQESMSCNAHRSLYHSAIIGRFGLEDFIAGVD